VRDLRNQLRATGQPIDDLQAVLDDLNRLAQEGLYADPNNLAAVHADMLNRLKRIEFGLRREVEGDSERGATLTGSDEVPDGYRESVEEYYRYLARAGSGRGGN